MPREVVREVDAEVPVDRVAVELFDAWLGAAMTGVGVGAWDGCSAQPAANKVAAMASGARRNAMRFMAISLVT
jgi:hypothetical protein